MNTGDRYYRPVNLRKMTRFTMFLLAVIAVVLISFALELIFGGVSQ